MSLLKLTPADADVVGMAATDDLLARFADYQYRRGFTDATVDVRGRVLRHFFTYLTLIDPDPFSATAVDVDEWLAGCELASRSRGHYLSHVAMFYRWAIREGLTEANPTERIERPRLPRLLPRPVSDEAKERAIDAAPPLMRAWLCLMAYAGMRCQEVAGLCREDIDLEAEVPLVVIRSGKGGHERALVLNTKAEKALRDLGLPVSGRLWEVTPYVVSRRVGVYLRSLGIDATAHQFRHWFGTTAYRKTRDLRLVQELMGHASPMTTAGYAAFAPAAAGVVRDL